MSGRSERLQYFSLQQTIFRGELCTGSCRLSRPSTQRSRAYPTETLDLAQRPTSMV
jgi:hypothetical protein